MTTTENMITTQNPLAAIDRAVFADAINRVARVTDKRSAIPVLSNVLIGGGNSSLFIQTTDLDMTMTAVIPAAVDSRLRFTVPVHDLDKIVKKTKACENVKIEQRIDSASFNMGSLTATLDTIATKEWPAFEMDSKCVTFDVPTDEIKTLFGKVAFAVSNEDSRYYLNGVYLEVFRQNHPGPVALRTVATDGHRLARYEGSTPIPGKHWGATVKARGAIVPTKCVVELLRLVKARGAPETVTVSVSKKQIAFKVGVFLIVTKTIDCTYPDYARVIPEHNNQLFVFDRKGLIESVDQASILVAQNNRGIKVTVTDRTATIALSGDSAKMSVTLPVDSRYACEFGVNAKYLLDALATMEGETVTLEFTDMGSPLRFCDDSDDALTVVLMPMRVA